MLGLAKTLVVPAKNPYSRDLGHATQSDEDGEELKISRLISLLFIIFFLYCFCAVIFLEFLDFVDLQADD